MINAKSIADTAAAEFGLSLLDDKQIWAADDGVTAEIVHRTCQDVARDNANSALRRALGRLAEPLTIAFDVALDEDGALADLDAVAKTFIEDIDIDVSDFASASDWEAKLTLVRDALGAFADGYQVQPLTVAQLLAYANSDPRLHRDGLRPAIAALVYPGAADVMTEDIPAFLKREAPPVIPEAVDWGEDETPKPVKASATTAPKLCAMAALAGVPDQDMASIMNVSKAYYSLIRNGKRPWPGIKPDKLKALHNELDARLDLIAELKTALREGDIVKAEAV